MQGISTTTAVATDGKVIITLPEGIAFGPSGRTEMRVTSRRGTGFVHVGLSTEGYARILRFTEDDVLKFRRGTQTARTVANCTQIAAIKID